MFMTNNDMISESENVCININICDICRSLVKNIHEPTGMEWGRLNFQMGWFPILSIVRCSDHGIFGSRMVFMGHPKAPHIVFFFFSGCDQSRTKPLDS